VLIHVIIFLTSANLNTFSIAAAPIIYGGEYYRILSSAFVHGGFFHILMNMMSLMQLGPGLELKFGTLSFASMTLWAIVVAGSLYVSISWFCGTMSGDPAWMVHSGVGYSGVLFVYATLESYHTTVQSRSVFGFFSVPARVYPWILLVLLSVVLPGISFLGHLCGILTGMLFITGALQLCMPAPLFLRHAEEYACLRWLTRMDTFSRTADKPFTADTEGGLGGMIFTVLLYACFFVETVLGICGCRVNLAGRLQAMTGPADCIAAMGSWLGGFTTRMGAGGAGYTPPWAAAGQSYSTLGQRENTTPDEV